MAHDIQVAAVRTRRCRRIFKHSLIYLRNITKMETRNLKLTQIYKIPADRPDQIFLLS